MDTLNQHEEYNENIKKWKKAYREILGVCEKYPDFGVKYGFYDINDMTNKAKSHLLLIEWYEKYGLKLDHTSHDPHIMDFVRINSYLTLHYFRCATKCKTNSSGRYISWSDDGRQPEDGWYLVISFSTGAYIFGDDYNEQTQLFQDFFQELKSYNPDYSDTTNRELYWKIENSKKIFNDFDNVLEKYREKNKSELHERKVKKLRAELEKAEKELQ